MALNFSVTTRRDPRDRNSEWKYHATVKSKGRINAGQIASDMRAISAVNSTEIASALEAFMSVVPERLADGHIVELDGFGTFRVSVSSKGADHPRDVTTHSITDVRILFRPDKRLMEKFNAMAFEKIQDR